MSPDGYCAVEGCKSKLGGALSCFRCPKDEARSQVWKNQLGFTAGHHYAYFTPDKCYDNIRICSLHFTDDQFMSPLKQRLNCNAVPTLFLSGASSSANYSIQKEAVKVASASTQTDIRTKADAFFQTTGPITQDECCQTPMEMLLRLPRKPPLSQSKKKQQNGITLEDVERFLGHNYSVESSAFLKTQLGLLKKAPRGCRYSDEFKQFALSILYLGSKAYRKMATIYRLPSKYTIQRFAKRWIINPGFNDFVFGITKLRARLLKDNAKDCILCIDEMSIKSHLYYDISKDKIFGFQEGFNSNNTEIADRALVLMARGIASDWRQPIAYFLYKTSPTSDELKSILFESITRLNRTGLNVLAVVSDQGSNFYELVKTSLKLSVDNPSFIVNGKNICYIFDVPHLLKSTSYNFFSYKFIVNNEETDRRYLEQMFNFERQKKHQRTPRLSHQHNFEKTEVFSHSVAAAIDLNVLPPPTAEFIQKMNKFVDVLNSNAFMGSEILFLKEMDDIFRNLAVENSKGKNVTKQLKFIFGWRLTIKSICILLERHSSLMTGNLNQNCLESFFGQIRSCSGNVKNPTAIQFCRAFKKTFTLRYFGQAEGGKQKDINEVLLTFTPEILEEFKEFSVSRNIYQPIRISTNDYRDLEIPEVDALIYITEYLFKKCLQKHSCDICLGFNTSTELIKTENTFCDSKDGVVEPSNNITQYVDALENIFEQKFLQLASQSNVGNKLRDLFSNVYLEHPCENFPIIYFVNLYTRVRIYFTLKFADQNIKTCRTSKIDPQLSILQHL